MRRFLGSLYFLRNIRMLTYGVNGCYVIAMAKEKRFEMLADPSWLKRVDDWRKKQADILSRAEAIRRLVELGLSRGK